MSADATAGGGTRFYQPPNPVAGANLSVTSGEFRAETFRLVSCIATVATDATVASRLFSLDYILGRGTTAIRNAATVLITASQAATVYQWDRAHKSSEWQTGTPVFVPLVDLTLAPGWTIQLTLDNKQAGDQISSVTFVLEEIYADR